MPRSITGLEVQKRNHQRLSVYLDGDYAFGVSRFVGAWLHVGQELSEEKIAELIAEDTYETAYQKAIKFISYRMRTISEVDKHLRKKGIDAQVIEQVIDRLEENGLLNDKNFAQMWIENRTEFRPRSQRLLAVELRKKGIGSEIIENVMESTLPEDELAYLAAQKRIRRYENLERMDFQKKLGSFLARRGFSYATIKPVVNRIWSENHQDDDC